MEPNLIDLIRMPLPCCPAALLPCCSAALLPLPPYSIIHDVWSFVVHTMRCFGTLELQHSDSYLSRVCNHQGDAPWYPNVEVLFTTDRNGLNTGSRSPVLNAVGFCDSLTGASGR